MRRDSAIVVALTVTVVVGLLAIPPPTAPSVPTAGSGLVPATSSPSVRSDTTYAAVAAGATTSPSFASTAGDLVLVWISLYGKEWVRSVTDSAGDSFVQDINSSMAYGTSGARNGLAVWAASGAAGGSAVTVTTTFAAPSGWPVLSAVSVVDVTSVSTNPIDWLGTPTNTSALSGQQSNHFDSRANASANDLVLAGVAARSEDNFTALGGDARVNLEDAQLPGSTTWITTAVFDYPEGPTSGSVWMNASSNRTVAWVGDSLSVRPSGGPVYKVRFVESGLPLASSWDVDLNGLELGSNLTAISFFEPNGTYAYSVGPSAAFAVTHGTGNISVKGANVTQSVTFSGYLQHVVVIMMENGEVGTILSADPYQRYLSNTYGNDSEFYATCHQSPPNYFALVSGRTIDCEKIKGGVANVTDLPDTLQAAGLSWGGYFESMPKPCDTSSTTTYGTDHNPFLLFQDIVDNASRCDAHVVNSDVFNESLANGTLPSFSYYVPNQLDDCHSSKRSFCDAWLKGFLSPILNSTSSKVTALLAHTAFVVVYDEGKTNKGYYVGGLVTPYCLNLTGYKETVCGGHTYATVISPYSVGTAYRSDSTDISLTSTIEWLFDLGSDGGWDGTSNFPPLASLFDFP